VAPADELVRVALGPGGQPVVGRLLPGRGAWLCAGSTACFEQAVRRGSFGRAFRRPIDPGALERLGLELRAAGGGCQVAGQPDRPDGQEAPGPAGPTRQPGGAGPSRTD